MSTTQKIRSIGREARVNQLISERLEHWKAAMRERGIHLVPCSFICVTGTMMSLDWVCYSSALPMVRRWI